MPRGGHREGAGRPKKDRQLNPRTLTEIKAKIKAAAIIKRLQDHLDSDATDDNGRPVGTMSGSAVTAALGLLRKVLPDLAAVEHSGALETKRAEDMTDDELAAIAAGGRVAVDAPPVDPAKLN